MSDTFIPATSEVVELSRRFAADSAAGGGRSAPERRMAVTATVVWIRDGVADAAVDRMLATESSLRYRGAPSLVS